FRHWYKYAAALVQTGDVGGYRSLTDRAIPQVATAREFELLDLDRLLLFTPQPARRHPGVVRAQAAGFRLPQNLAWERWVRGLGLTRLGQAPAGLPLLEAMKSTDWKGAVALTRHQAGQIALARQALQQADLHADQQMRTALAGDSLGIR